MELVGTVEGLDQHFHRATDLFTERVGIRLDLDSSLLDMADVALFAPDLQGIQFPLQVSGRFRGTIAELKGRDLDIRFGRRSAFTGRAEMSGS